MISWNFGLILFLKIGEVQATFFPLLNKYQIMKIRKCTLPLFGEILPDITYGLPLLRPKGLALRNTT